MSPAQKRQRLAYHKVCNLKRRHKKLGLPTDNILSAGEWRRLVIGYNCTCLRCGRTAEYNVLTIDHVSPLSKCGRSDLDNIQPLCEECNTKKGVAAIDYRRRPLPLFTGITV